MDRETEMEWAKAGWDGMVWYQLWAANAALMILSFRDGEKNKLRDGGGGKGEGRPIFVGSVSKSHTININFW